MEAYLLTNLPVFIKLSLAIILGALIGIERTKAGKMAGIRTYALVSLGSCLLTTISTMVLADYGNPTSSDIMRMAGAIVMGVGFLCGGIIIFHDNKLVGLTTAAGMWVAIGIGITVGFGYFTIATMVTVLTLFIFSTLWEVEEKIIDSRDNHS